MGSYSILVIGDWREELEPHLEAAHIGNPLSPHISRTNILNEALKEEHRLSQSIVYAQDRVSFPRWLRKRFGLHILDADGLLDLAGIHRSGWIGLNGNGEVTEVIQRNQGATIMCVSGELNQFLLKPGAMGWEVDPYQLEDIETTQRYASSARLRDIDFAAMRQPKVDRAPATWHWAHRVASGRTWTPFSVILKKYADSPKYQTASDGAAREWSAQPIIAELREYEFLRGCWPYEFDALLLSCDQYIQHCERYASVLEYGEVMSRGSFLGRPNEAELLAQLDNDTLLTSVIVKQ